MAGKGPVPALFISILGDTPAGCLGTGTEREAEVMIFSWTLMTLSFGKICSPCFFPFLFFVYLSSPRQRYYAFLTHHSLWELELSKIWQDGGLSALCQVQHQIDAF